MISAEEEDISGSYRILLGELKKYNPELLAKERLLAITKCDLVDKERRKQISRHLPKKIAHYFISSFSGEGLQELKDGLWTSLNG